MPRPFRLVRSLSESELQRALQGQTNLRIRERIQTILLLYNRHTVTEAARRIGRSRSAVQGWLKRWNTRGLDGLRPAFKGRHPNILLEDMDKALNELVANGGATTVSNLLSHISRTRNLNYSFNGVLKVLYERGGSAKVVP